MACLEEKQGARYGAFMVSAQPGRVYLLAILTDEPLGLDGMPNEPKVPARLHSTADIDTLLARLRDLEGGRWTALSTYFDVMA